MPVAAGLLVLAWAGGGTAVDESDGDGWALAVHAGLMLAAFASFLGLRSTIFDVAVS